MTTPRREGSDRLDLPSSLLERGADINGLYEFPRNKGGEPKVPREQTATFYDAAKRGD